MKYALVIGGSNGIGLSIALNLSLNYSKVVIVDRVALDNIHNPKIEFFKYNLSDNNLDFLELFSDIDTLIITAGFGRVAPFESITPKEIDNSFDVNVKSAIKIIHYFYPKMISDSNFYCAIMGSIAGLISSPLFALYGSTKAALCKVVESLNIELELKGSCNRILNVSPGSIQGTKFNGGANDLDLTNILAENIILNMKNRETIYIPDYEAVYKGVIARYLSNPHEFGVASYNYKIENNRINLNPQIKIGYLSGTFDLFHIGHLNLLKRAKEYCDYLVVGVHKDALHKGKDTFISFEERCEILRNIKCVDRVIPSEKEDCDVYINGIIKYDFLFVGSDYKGTERFNRYEDYFRDTKVEIVYFPYTKGTSSTKLRDSLSAYNKNL